MREAAQRLTTGQGDAGSDAAEEELQRSLGLDTRPLAEQLADLPGGGGGEAPLSSQLALTRRCEFTLNLVVSGPEGANASAAATAEGNGGDAGGGLGQHGAEEGGGNKKRRVFPAAAAAAAVVGDTDAMATDDGAEQVRHSRGPGAQRRCNSQLCGLHDQTAHEADSAAMSSDSDTTFHCRDCSPQI